MYNSKQNEPSKTNPTLAFFAPFHARFPVFWCLLALYWEKDHSSGPCVRAIPLQEKFPTGITCSCFQIVCWTKVVSFADNSTQCLHLKHGKTHAQVCLLPRVLSLRLSADAQEMTNVMDIMWTRQPNAADFDWDFDLSLKKIIIEELSIWFRFELEKRELL